MQSRRRNAARLGLELGGLLVEGAQFLFDLGRFLCGRGGALDLDEGVLARLGDELAAVLPGVGGLVAELRLEALLGVLEGAVTEQGILAGLADAAPARPGVELASRFHELDDVVLVVVGADVRLVQHRVPVIDDPARTFERTVLVDRDDESRGGGRRYDSGCGSGGGYDGGRRRGGGRLRLAGLRFRHGQNLPDERLEACQSGQHTELPLDVCWDARLRHYPSSGW